MAVPDTTTFTLIEVTQAIAGAQDDLIECFAEAKSYGFNALYSGSKNSLLNFRDYDEGVSVNPTSIEAPKGGGIYIINIDTRTSWTLNESTSWIIPSTTSGAGPSSPSLQILENNTTSIRVAQVIINVLNWSATIIVIQSGS